MTFVLSVSTAFSPDLFFRALWFVAFTSASQPTFTCSKLTIETLEQSCETCSKLTIKLPKRRHRFGGFIFNIEHISHLCSSVSIVNFEHVIAGWDKLNIACVGKYFFLRPKPRNFTVTIVSALRRFHDHLICGTDLRVTINSLWQSIFFALTSRKITKSLTLALKLSY